MVRAGWRLRGAWWTNAWLSERIEWQNICGALVPSVTAIWESWSPERKAKAPVQAINGRCLKCVTGLSGSWFEGKHQRSYIHHVSTLVSSSIPVQVFPP
jgi:hypothetical protein